MVCQNCGANLDDGLLYCTECGGKVEPPEPVCAICGAKIEPGNAFCVECGTPFEGASSVPVGGGESHPIPPEPPQQTPPEPAVEKIHCTNCGAVMNKSDTLCPQCGAASVTPPPALPPKKATSSLSFGKHGVKIAVAAACVVLVAVMALFGRPIREALDPHLRVINSFQRTADAFHKAGRDLTDRVDFLSALKGMKGKAFTASASLGIRDNNIPDPLAQAMSIQCTTEYDRAGRKLYAAVEYPGPGRKAEFCAAGNLAGIRSPLLGNQALAVRTDTLGADLKASSLAAFLDIPVDLIPDSYSLSLFTEDQPFAPLSNLLLGDKAQQKEISQAMESLWEDLLDRMKVTKKGKTQLEFRNGKTVTGAQLIATVPAEDLQAISHKLLETIKGTASIQRALDNGDLPPYALDFLQATIDSLLVHDLTMNLSIDNKGRVVAVDASYDIASYGQSILFRTTLKLNDYETLVNDISMMFQVNSAGSIVQCTLASSGNHNGNGGLFDDTTTFTVAEDGQAVGKLAISTDYTANTSGGVLRTDLSASGMGMQKVSLSGKFGIDVAKNKNAVTLSLEDLRLPQMYPMGLSMTELTGSLEIKKGISNAADQFFGNDYQEVLKLTGPELAALFQVY